MQKKKLLSGARRFGGRTEYQHHDTMYKIANHSMLNYTRALDEDEIKKKDKIIN